MGPQVQRLRLILTATFRDYPWIGWASWIAFCLIALLRTDQRRFGSTFEIYFHAAQRLIDQQQVYDPTHLTDYIYPPVSLLVLVPFTHIDLVAAAAITLVVYAGIFTLACAALARRLFPDGAHGLKPLTLAGILLLINIPAAWFNFKGVQSQIIMTGAMIAAAATMMRAQWLWASFWLFIALVFKPLAIVMVLLCGTLCAPMRWPLIAAILVMLMLPFAFFDWSYLAAQYQFYGLKLWAVATAPPSEWPYQADITTLLRAVGIVLPSLLAVSLRIACALATLWLAWRVKRTGDMRSFALAVLILAGCYITLFGPRNEYLSFLVLTPSLTALAFLLLARNESDARAWLLIAAALVLGFVWRLSLDVWLKPAIVLVIYLWLVFLMVLPQRWHDLTQASRAPQASGPS
jgi:hypothetical protein